jgi:phosphosulfolactate phosphohydrolase-like enzyme
MFYDQTEYAIRFEWGAPGVDVLAVCSDVVIIVDVLSFSTCVDIATASSPAALQQTPVCSTGPSSPQVLAGEEEEA